jgi:hypothetical protein
MIEWTRHQGGKIKEAAKGKEEQGKESSRCKEGNVAVFFGNNIPYCWIFLSHYVQTVDPQCVSSMCRPRLEMLQRRSEI